MIYKKHLKCTYGDHTFCSDAFESPMHLTVCVDKYFETLSMLTPLLTNFAVATFASSLSYTLLSRYEYYIVITIVNFISIYQYIMHITTDLINLKQWSAVSEETWQTVTT